MSKPIQECSIAEATWLRKWVIVNPFNISERMEFDSVHDLAQHLFNSKELILNMVKERDALKAEVERLKEGNECLDKMHEKEMARSAYLCEQVERLRKAGDGMEEVIWLNGCLSGMQIKERAVKVWNATKEGKTQS